MAYGQNTAPAATATRPAYNNAAGGAKKAFEKDPNEVGIAYLKTSDKVGSYFSVSITADIPAGAKLVIFENKTKNRTDKTPTHVIKLSTAAKKS